MSSFQEDICVSLKSLILGKYPSIKQFCEENNIDRHNLSKVFSGRQNISIGLYLRINVALGVLCPEHNKYNRTLDMPLIDYVELDFFAVQRAIIHNLRNV